MIFSIQRQLEDFFERRGLRDPDQYAVKLANFYDQNRSRWDRKHFLRSMNRIHTLFFRANTSIIRADFESQVLATLDKRHKNCKKKKVKEKPSLDEFPGGVQYEKKRIRSHPKRISNLLSEFSRAVQARCVDVFWRSRSARHLRNQPEQVGQALLATFLKGVLRIANKGLVLREMASGIGFVDIAVILSNIPHLIELKVLKSSLKGVNQLSTYMRTEARKVGWLVVFDARHTSRKAPLPSKIKTPAGLVNVICIDINPMLPSRQ